MKPESQTPEEIAISDEVLDSIMRDRAVILAEDKSPAKKFALIRENTRAHLAVAIRSEREKCEAMREALEGIRDGLRGTVTPETERLVLTRNEQLILRTIDAAMRGALESKWQPIETAPRDGTNILLWWPDQFHCSLTGHFATKWVNGYGWKVTGWGDANFETTPTHWQLLPAAPKETQRCAYGDPFCPCQDGDTCHYEGSNAMRPKKAQS